VLCKLYTAHCAVPIIRQKRYISLSKIPFLPAVISSDKKYLSLSTKAFLPFTVFENRPTVTIAIFRVSVSRRFRRLGKWLISTYFACILTGNNY
jgi:hypothetical protein